MADNRKKLEEIALKKVQHSGLGGLSFRTLADDVGIKSSSVHYHFPEKSDLARVLIEGYSANFFERLDTIGKKNCQLKRKLKEFIAIFENVAKQGKICLCGMLASEIAKLDVPNRKLLEDFFSNTEDWLIAQIKHHASELKSELSPKVFALSLLSGLEGALILDRVLTAGDRLKAHKTWALSMVE